jgi:uncharacterized membrane protein YjdF
MWYGDSKQEGLRGSNVKNRLFGIIYIIMFVFLVISHAAGLRDKGASLYPLTLLTALAYLLPAILEKTLRIVFPPLLKLASIMFVFLCLDLGAVLSLYTAFPWWDSLIHFASGFLVCTFGLSLISILNGNRPLILKLMKPRFIATFIFVFSMAVGVLWEYIEFSSDSLFGTDLMHGAALNGGQTDGGLLDTISDLFFSQASAFMMSMYYYHAIKSDKWLKLSKVMIQLDR